MSNIFPKAINCSGHAVSERITKRQQLVIKERQRRGGLIGGRVTWAAALTAMGAGQAFRRRGQDRERRGMDGDRIQSLSGRDGGLRRARSVEAGEVNQRVCGFW